MNEQAQPGFPERAARVLTRPLTWFFLALLIRLLYFQESSGSFQFYQQMLDEQEVAHAAQFGFGEEPLFKAPLYPWVLRVVMAVTGEGWIYTMRLLQHLLGAVLVLLLFDTTHRLSRNQVAAAVAAALGAFYGPVIRLEDRLILDFFVLFLQGAMLWALVRSRDGERGLHWVAVAAVFAGLAWLNRPTILPVLPFIALWIYVAHDRSLKRVAVFLAVPLLALAGLTLRNGLVSGEYLVNPWQGGYNFYLGNNADANGRYIKQMSFDVSQSGNPTRVRMMDAYRKAHADETDFAFTFKGLNDYWYGLGKQAILDDVPRWLGLMVRKGFYLVTAREIYNFEDYNIQRSLSFWLKPAAINFGVIWPLALGSLVFVRLRGDRQALMWLYIVLLGGAIALFFCSGRLRMPLMFPVAVLAAFGVVEAVRSRKYRVYLPLVLAGVCLSWIDWWGVRSEDVAYVEYARLSNAAWRAEEYDLALDLVEKAAASKQNYPALPVLRGQALLALGRIDEAIEEFERARRYLKRDPVPAYNLGLIYYGERNDVQKARFYFAWASELQYPPAVPRLARAELRIDEIKEARRLMQPLLDAGLASADLQTLITAIFLFEAEGQRDRMARTTELLAQRFGPDGLEVFEKEIGYYKRPMILLR